jgi:hypothetical protein
MFDKYFVQIEEYSAVRSHCSTNCLEGYVSHRKLLEKNILDDTGGLIYVQIMTDAWGTYQIHRNGRLCCESCLEIVVALVGSKGCVDVAYMAYSIEHCKYCVHDAG